MSRESTYSGVGAEKVLQNVVLRTVIVHSSFFLQIQLNGRFLELSSQSYEVVPAVQKCLMFHIFNHIYFLDAFFFFSDSHMNSVIKTLNTLMPNPDSILQRNVCLKRINKNTSILARENCTVKHT